MNAHVPTTGPRLDPAEIELADVATVEVLILWGATVLHVAHLTPPRSFYVGEAEEPGAACDYLVPVEKLGTTRAPVVLVQGGRIWAVVPSGASATIELPGRFPLPVRLEGAEACPELTGARQIELAPGDKARVEHAGFVYQVTAARAGRPVAAGIFARRDPAGVVYSGLSLLAHASVMGAMAMFVPPMGLDDEETAKRQEVQLIQQYMTSIAERERMDRETPEDAQGQADIGGESGERHQGEEGSMGRPDSKKVGHMYGVQGNAAPQDAHLARERALKEAATFGLITILNGGGGGDPNAPTSPFGRDESLGSDPYSAMGNMWGDSIDDSAGAGGLGLTNIGEGGGGHGTGVGLGCIAGLGECGNLGHGIGPSRGARFAGHATKAPSVRSPGITDVKGRLPAEIIQRIVRQNYGRFRSCYESGLRTNPNLSGRVATRFVIGRDGAVSNVANGDSDLPDSSVVQCVARSYYALTFPAPDNGIVTVVYPIMFTPGG
jgi:hypothetical protein